MADQAVSVPFAVPNIGAEEEEAVLRVMRSGWLTTGGGTLAFEKEFAEFLRIDGGDAPFCLAVNSATSGLHLALEAFGVRAGDVVFVPAYTFTSTAEVVRYLGAEPVFVDSMPGEFNIDPCALEEAIEKILDGKNPYTGRPERWGKPRAVIPVHFGGAVCDMRELMRVARRYDLKVIEDAAHAFPSAAPCGWAGTIGDAGVFSFYATKTITTGEGGMVVCADGDVARRIAVMRSHGIDRSVWNRYTDTKASWYYEVIEAGYKYNLPDILAAIGRVQLRRARDLLEMRVEIAARYDAAFSDNDSFIIPPSSPGDARHLYPLRLNLAALSISRDEFIVKLQKKGIGVSVHFIPLHIMPFYKKRYAIAGEDLPNAVQAFRQVVSLPIWPGMSAAQVERVIAVVKDTAREYTV